MNFEPKFGSHKNLVTFADLAMESKAQAAKALTIKPKGRPGKITVTRQPTTWTFTLSPVVVVYADLVSHWTRSGQNYAIMKKTFRYLLFMVIILLTLGFTSSHAHLGFLLENKDLNWECIFLPDSGAFCINYLITSAMIRSGLELIGFPESPCKAVTPAIRKAAPAINFMIIVFLVALLQFFLIVLSY